MIYEPCFKIYILSPIKCLLLITFAKSFDPVFDNDLMVFLKEFFENINFENYQQTNKESCFVHKSSIVCDNLCKQFGPRLFDTGGIPKDFF